MDIAMNICIFGAGKRGLQLKEILEEEQIEIAAFLDNIKSGEVSGVNIYSIEKALQVFGNNIFVIISMSDTAICEAVRRQLETYGLKRGRNYLIWKELLSNIQNKDECLIEHPAGMHKIYELQSELERLCKEFMLPDMELTEDEQSLQLMFQLLGTGNVEALFIRYYLNKCVKRAEGDICEFGIAQGATSALMANDIRRTDKILWLFDSFEGLSSPTEKDVLIDDIFNYGSMEKYAFSMKHDIYEVKERLRKINVNQDRIKIIPGFIEDTVKQEAVLQNLTRVSFAYVDFDLYEPVLTALEFLHERTSRGSVVIVDDYNFFSAGARIAVDEFISKYKDTYKLLIPEECAGKFCVIEKSSDK